MTRAWASVRLIGATLVCLCALAAWGCRKADDRDSGGGATGTAAGLQVRADPNRPDRFLAQFSTMGTDGTVIVLAADRADAERMLRAAVAPLDGVMAAMSTYRPDSEISRLNAGGAEGEVPVGPHLARVLRECVRFGELTDGAFDVTYAPLRTLWRAADESERMPTDDELAAALTAVGWRKLVLADSGAHFAAAGMELDLGGIAKGYGIDLAAEAMIAAGATSGLVSIGGDMRLIGRREGGERWKVQVRDPRAEPGGPIYLRLADCAVATSGDYARSFRVGERRLSHIIDPRTGRPVESVPSVTVVAPDATSADALATALSVLGPEKGVAVVEKVAGAECMILTRPDPDRPDELAAAYSSGFRALTEGELP